MNDNRLPIPAGTEITDYHAGKAVTFSVADVIGCGGSCIAYNAFYTDAYGIRHDLLKLAIASLCLLYAFPLVACTAFIA